jgi:hypothetical protein
MATYLERLKKAIAEHEATQATLVKTHAISTAKPLPIEVLALLAVVEQLEALNAKRDG